MVVVNTKVNTIYRSETHQHGFQQKKVCSNPLGRGEGERIYILTRFRYALQESKVVLWTCSSGMFKIISRRPGLMLYTVRWVCVCVAVCVYVCMYVCKHAWWICPSVLCFWPACRSFQIPFVALDGLFDAQQEGCVPLVQTWDRVKLLYLQTEKNADTRARLIQ